MVIQVLEDLKLQNSDYLRNTCYAGNRAKQKRKFVMLSD